MNKTNHMFKWVYGAIFQQEGPEVCLVNSDSELSSKCKESESVRRSCLALGSWMFEMAPCEMIP